MRVPHQIYATVFNIIYLGLTTNLLVAAACSPLLAGLLFTDPARSWPLLALMAPLCAPGLVGVFAVLAAYSQDGSTAVFIVFCRAWRAALPRALTVGALSSVVLVVLGVDVAWAVAQPLGGLVLPVLVVLMALVVGTAVLTLAALAEHPSVRVRHALRVCGFLAVQRWCLTAASVGILALGQVLLAASPLLALGVASAPLLFLVWANSRVSLVPALGGGDRAVPA
jgi:uncharacterized membrane protein YesL